VGAQVVESHPTSGDKVAHCARDAHLAGDRRGGDVHRDARVERLALADVQAGAECQAEVTSRFDQIPGV
jgi:hypothetical protein